MPSKAYKSNYDNIDWSHHKPVTRIKHKTNGKRSDSFPVPFIVRPFSEPVQSMADGKYYDDQSSLRATYKAANNPQGVDYVEVGNEDITKFEAPKRDKQSSKDAIERAISKIDNGYVPPMLNKLPA